MGFLAVLMKGMSSYEMDIYQPNLMLYFTSMMLAMDTFAGINTLLPWNMSFYMEDFKVISNFLFVDLC